MERVGDALAAVEADGAHVRLAGPVAAMRVLGSGDAPSHRFRIGLEFAVSGRRDVDAMLEHHASIARALGEQLGLPEAVLPREVEVLRLLARGLSNTG